MIFNKITVLGFKHVNFGPKGCFGRRRKIWKYKTLPMQKPSPDFLTPCIVHVIMTLNAVRYFPSFLLLHNSEVTVNLSHWDPGVMGKCLYERL